MGSNSVLTTLIQDAILKLCTQNVLFDASLEIDGIICISPGQESKEIVVKMHRTIMKPTPEPEVFQPEPSPKSTPHRRNRNQQAHSSNIESDTFPAQTSNISFDEMPKHDTYQDESGGATAYFPDEQQQYDTTPSKQSRKRRQPQTPTDTSSEEKYIKVEPGEGEILVEEPTNMPAAAESNDSYSDTSQGILNQAYSTLPAYTGETEFVEDSTVYACTTCSREFPSKACLESHNMVIHNRYCETCQQRLDNLSSEEVKAHGLSHNGVKPYQCSYCMKLFNTAPALQYHQKKDFRCTLCGKNVHSVNRAKHKRFHQKSKH